MRVLLVCDVGTAVGLGHWSRTRALADALRERGAETKILAFGEAMPRDPERFAAATLLAADADFAGEVLRAARESAADAVVFDLHVRRVEAKLPELFRALSAAGSKVVGVDSVRELVDALDLLCIPSFHVDAAFLARHAGKLVSGWDSLLVEARLPLRDWSPGRRVLVLTGGSDTKGLANILPGLLEARLPPGTQVDWVRGPYAQAPAMPAAPVLDWTVHHAPDGLDALMVACSHALTVFGVTLLELLKYGVPTVVFSPYGADNDVELDVLRGTGACVVADGAEDAVARLAGLMRDDATARRLSTTARHLLAAAGPDLLAQRIVDMVG